MEKSKLIYLVLILLLLIVTAYLTTAFFVKFWPFNQTNTSATIDLSAIAKNIEKRENDNDPLQPDLSKGVVGEDGDPYNVSDGTPYDCGSYSIAFPKDWLVVLQNKGRLAISSDLRNSTNSIYISQTDNLTFDSENMDKTLADINESLDQEFAVEQIDKTDFLGKKCLTVSGSSNRNGVKSGLLAIAIPSDSKAPGYWIIGFFDPQNPSIRDDIVASMATMSINMAR